MRIGRSMLVCALLTGCQAASSGLSSESGVRVDPKQIDLVLARVKQEIGLFLDDSVEVDKRWPALLNDLRIKPVCGNGKIDFTITSVKMEFEAVRDVSGGANAGLKIPVLPSAAAANISPSVKANYENSATERVSYAYYPPTLAEYKVALARGAHENIPDDVRRTAAILPALNALRDALIRETAHYPCFRSTRAKDPDQEISFQVVLVDDKDVSGGFDFYIVSLGSSVERKSTGGNTITVSFRPLAENGSK